MRRRNRIVRAEYRLTREQYDAMVIDQQGRCGICEVPTPGLRIDHDHQTGIIRELLCHACNLAVGWLEQDPLRTQAARDYVARHTKPAPEPW